MFVLNPCNRPFNSDIGGATDALTFFARHKPFCSVELAVGRSQRVRVRRPTPRRLVSD
jgi:hypothetical protein